MTAQAAARRDLTSITDAFLPFVLILLDTVRCNRARGVELTSKVSFIWGNQCRSVKVVVSPAEFVDAYSVVVTFGGDHSFLETLKEQLCEELTEELKSGVSPWDVWEPITASGELRFTVSEPGI